MLRQWCFGLMMFANGCKGVETLASAVQLLLQGGPPIHCWPIADECAASGFRAEPAGIAKHARDLPKLVCRQVSQENCRAAARGAETRTLPPGSGMLLVVDGSSLELDHDRQLLQL